MTQILNWVPAVTARAASARFHELKAVGVGGKKKSKVAGCFICYLSELLFKMICLMLDCVMYEHFFKAKKQVSGC